MRRATGMKDENKMPVLEAKDTVLGKSYNEVSQIVDTHD